MRAEAKVLELAKRLSQSGYKFSTYMNLARAIYDVSLDATLSGRVEDHVGLSPGLIREVLLRHRKEIEKMFGVGGRR